MMTNCSHSCLFTANQGDDATGREDSKVTVLKMIMVKAGRRERQGKKEAVNEADTEANPICLRQTWMGTVRKMVEELC